ncbi:uncharacterized protein G2W53_037107 [Senna tora]|uniref:Uncharacterized protein n=1 Tax=Senna tora TaxID=362788 RepID=A0A834WAU2_9FABA|nr:uncharacterized protein G2W53_037107 [Senna tora]
MGRSPPNGGYSCNVSTLNSSKSGSDVVAERTFLAVQRWKLCHEGGHNEGMFRRRAKKESMMLLLKVQVISIEGVDDGMSYAVQDEQEVEVGMGVIDDDTTKGSNYMSGRSQRWHYRSASDNSKDVEEFDDGECEQRQQGQARGCVEGIDDGATEDSDSHVKLKQVMAMMLAKRFGSERCITFIRWGGDDQPWMLRMPKLKVRMLGVLNDFRYLECQKVHHFTLLGFHPLLVLHLRRVEGCCLFKSTSTLNLSVLVSCTLLAGGSRWLLFCCYKTKLFVLASDAEIVSVSHDAEGLLELP